jgi:hypothetical protein
MAAVDYVARPLMALLEIPDKHTKGITNTTAEEAEI